MKSRFLTVLCTLGLAVSPMASAEVFTEDFSDPLGDWTTAWLYQNSNLENFYTAAGTCDPNYRGNNPIGLWISDDRGCGGMVRESPVQINILNGFGDMATSLSLDICSIFATTLEVYDKDGALDASVPLNAPVTTNCSTAVDYPTQQFDLTNGLSRIDFVGQVENWVAVDNVVLDTTPSQDTTARARFTVTKDFTDDNPMPVEVTLTCNGGLPLTQSFEISDSGPTPAPVHVIQATEGPGTPPSNFDSVSFVLTNFQEGETDCTVVETTGLDDYTPSYDDGTPSTVNCSFEDITSGGYTCEIINTPVPGEYTVAVNWEIVESEAGSEEENYDVGIDVTCTADILTVNGSVVSPSMEYSGTLGDGESVVLGVDTSTGPASCSTTQTLSQSGVEPMASSECTDGAVDSAENTTCTFTNTVFFEGIPTLSQWGIAVMALMMLGLGLLGFRRFS